MSKHSPGPWHIHVNAADDLEVNAADGSRVVMWYQSQDCLSPGDAGLIAAAPEMLALLQSLDEDVDDCDLDAIERKFLDFDAKRVALLARLAQGQA